MLLLLLPAVAAVLFDLCITFPPCGLVAAAPHELAKQQSSSFTTITTSPIYTHKIRIACFNFSLVCCYFSSTIFLLVLYGNHIFCLFGSTLLLLLCAALSYILSRCGTFVFQPSIGVLIIINHNNNKSGNNIVFINSSLLLYCVYAHIPVSSSTKFLLTSSYTVFVVIFLRNFHLIRFPSHSRRSHSNSCGTYV